MRRLLLYFSLLAVTLIGVGKGVGTLECMLGAQPAGVTDPVRDPGPRRCHSRNVLPPFATEPTRVAPSTLGVTLARKEPNPCPGFALQAAPPPSATRYARRAHPMEAPPVGLAPPLALNCVLRI